MTRTAKGPGTETQSFKFADRRIEQVVGKLKEKGACGCCVARALLYHGANLYEGMVGSIEAAEELEQMAAVLRDNATPAPEHGAQLH
jgi:hypothetical protein